MDLRFHEIQTRLENIQFVDYAAFLDLILNTKQTLEYMWDITYMWDSNVCFVLKNWFLNILKTLIARNPVMIEQLYLYAVAS